jgi:hypothetical protein
MIPRLDPRLTIERAIARESMLEPRSWMNERSILILSKGKLRRRAGADERA